MASNDDDLSPRPSGPVLVRVARRLAAGAVIASVPLGACGGDDDAATDAGVDAIIGPMPPPADTGIGEEDAGFDGGGGIIIGPMPPPMPPPMDAGVDAGSDAGVIPPMPPPADAGIVPPMPPPPMPPPMPPPAE